MTAGDRLQKVLARAGYGSRRGIEEMIRQGQISVNDKTAELGQTVTPQDKIKVKGKLVPKSRLYQKAARVLIYNKPTGEVCTRSDPEGRPTVFDHLPKLRNERWVSIGRLDINTSGLLLFTTQGDLANNLMHPSQEVEREYAVRVLGEVSNEVLKNLTMGVYLDDGPAKFEKIVDKGGKGVNHWYHVVIKEGRNREVRRLWESQGVQVSRLMRIRFGDIELPRGLRLGKSEELNAKQVDALYQKLKKD